MMKLKHSEIKEYREKLLIEQNNCCGLCGEFLSIEEAVLDHNHSTGFIRKVLHRGCNALEGIIVNNMKRNRVDLLRLEFICSNLPSYIATEWTTVVHPTYRTEEEKKQARAASRKRAAQRRKKNASL